MAKKNKVDSEGYQLLKQEFKQGALSGVYVLHGEESYLIESCRSKFKKLLVEDFAEDFNYHRFNPDNFRIEDFQEAVEAIPMMSEKSLVEVTDINFFGLPESDRNLMADIFSDLPEYCTILFLFDAVEWKPDKRLKKLWSAFEPVAKVFALNKQPESELIPWIRRQLAREKKTISDDLCRYLLLQTGGSMTGIAAEISKLLAYTDQPQICRKDIDDVVIPVLEAAVFEITRDIGGKNFDGALVKLRNLLRQDESAIMINSVIGRQYRQMYMAKVLSEHGKGAFDLVNLCGIRDFAAREVYAQAKGFRKQQLKDCMRLSAETDLAMKSTGQDEQMLLETMLLQMGQMALEGRG